eukprot:CAMPEP_0116885538 /NCGR_PEP_ID=MMETSP0463-20121206/18977_1 /TAXON_ID=181622 /ORGANISM="Strombidinopsis sp, Strain SopsisLIS2011" /LENGTH=61 /DNA_ID=CAMNT_0004544237 /DNA_START=44 /DNA_END=226 /DNA_ORIENTATION=+
MPSAQSGKNSNIIYRLPILSMTESSNKVPSIPVNVSDRLRMMPVSSTEKPLIVTPVVIKIS